MDHLPGLNEVPPAPRRPSPQARHLVFGYRGSQGALLLIGSVFLVVGLIFTLLFCWGLPVDVAIGLGRREAPGRIVAAELNTRLKINGRRPTKVQFEYEAAGATWTGEANSFHVRPGQTGPVQVEYAALRPAWGRLAGDSYASFGYFGLVALVFPVLGALLARSAVQSNRKEIRAFTLGLPALARVTYKGQDRSVTVNGRHPFLMRCEFQAGGGVFQGSISSMKLQDIKAFGDAGQVVVLYDPADPGCNTLFVP